MAAAAEGRTVPLSLRARGRIDARFEAGPAGSTQLASLEEAGGYRMRLPRVHAARRAGTPAPVCEGTLINTGGGMAGGDRLSIGIEAGPLVHVAVSTPSAERVYGSSGAETEVSVRLRLGHGARLAWLPRETILFSGARLARRLDADIAADATLVIAEMTVFGRLAAGEEMRSGSFADRWRIRRDGRLLHAEQTRLPGRVHEWLDRCALGAGARATATLLMVSPQAEDRLEAARASLERAGCEAGASAWDGRLVARLLARDASPLRHALAALVRALTEGVLPHSWAGYEPAGDAPPSAIERPAPQVPDWRALITMESEVEPDPA
jgi:urease accessory protein